jgi:putative PIN family toxin of toxin-antitoxin system
LIIVFDASTLVSAALKANSIPEQALLRAVSEPNHLILSREIEDEYREVLFRPKFDRFVSVERRQLIVDIVVIAAERIEPVAAVRECRDPKDDKYLTLAAAGHANVIVSSDTRHLLAMHPWRGIPILSPAGYLALPWPEMTVRPSRPSTTTGS